MNVYMILTLFLQGTPPPVIPPTYGFFSWELRSKHTRFFHHRFLDLSLIS
jgi:hypothetical protein